LAWYADDAVIAGETGNEYTIKSADLGKTISVKATGTNSYEGSEAVAATGSPVKAIGKIVGVDRDGVTLGNNSTIGVGNKVTPIMQGAYYVKGKLTPLADIDGLVNAATITWTFEGKAAGNEKAAYTVAEGDAGKSWQVSASGIEAYDEGALVYTNGLEVADSAQSPVAVADNEKVDRVTEADYPKATQNYYYGIGTSWGWNAPTELATGSPVAADTTYYLDYETQQVYQWTQYRAKGNAVVLNNTWYRLNGGTYTKVNNLTQINSNVNYYKVKAGSPKDEGWYELVDDKYVPSTDTTIDPNEAYYVEL
jgi:hypothetical protein